ncbi:MAG: hypothetical protein JRJ87_08565 [Deltaproteobacteria bacterium]|nr:hypothetical protein [Deltaproteobacteria bacterium]
MIQPIFKSARGSQLTAGLAFLTIGLVGWLVIFPLLAPLHLAFASHKHRYCAVHHRYEDVLPESNPRAKRHSTVPFDNIPGLRAGTFHAAKDNHVACPFANLVSTNLALGSELDNSLAPVEDGCGRYENQPDGVAAISILARAPKHSPPAEVS